MRFSFWPSAGQPWADIRAAAVHAEQVGFDGVWFADHFMPFAGDPAAPMQECWTTLAALAALVPRVRLGSMVAGNTYRHPAVLLKQAVTVDQVAGGRVVLGIGAGWQENEHVAYGIDFHDVRGRLDRLEEACALITALQGERPASYRGRHYRLVDAPLSPAPAGGRLPLLVGGGGEQRTLRIAARYADEWNIWGTPELLAAKGAVLDARCAEVGRDPGTIARSANALLVLSEDEGWLADKRSRDYGRAALVGTPAEVLEQVARYPEAGVGELVVPDFALPAGSRKLDTLSLFMAEVAAHLR